MFHEKQQKKLNFFLFIPNIDLVFTAEKNHSRSRIVLSHDPVFFESIEEINQ